MNKDEEIITKCDDCSKTTGYALKDSLKTHELHFHPDQPADELLGVTKALTESPKDELQRCNEADKSSNDKQESKITEDNEITSFKMIKHDGFIGCEEEESNLIRDIPDYFSEVIRRKREIIDDEKWWLEESFSTQTKKNSCCSFCDNQRKMTVSEEEEEENNPPALIILDGHASRHNINLWKMFSSANVDVVVLPSHTSHILQPLDLGPNAELKKQLKRIKNEPTIRKMQTQFLPFVESITECAYMALAPMTIKHGFFEAGITSATIHHVLNKTIRELPPGMKKITQGNRWSISGKCITSDLVIQEWEEYEKARNNNAKIQQKLNNLKNKHLKCKPLTNKKRRKDAVVSETSENDLDSEQVEVGKIMGKSDSDISEYGSDESDSQAGEDSVISIPIFGIRESKESIENPIFRDRKEEKEESSEEAVLTKDCASLLSRETESENESDLLTVKKQRMKRKNDDSDYDYEKEKTDSASSEELDDLPKIYGTRSLRINKFHNDYVSS
ncbi:uncharacterized protein MONOS_2615 [Monocercomonoides exilis]|uniref:uncharacterized protein n=1 Tax=Monocercomonoides exilis TaxID=2049356 RepID=UPI00355ABE7C|nr:hypothetical protein MONOS_2615 [Monocercomonoides exilis]|eukprot:MONOS_2615.1-p1 / transcript=MONOS_2615.1 / gene=MONOS_2615 / organism=Monocercomonoides_exilis_PA203 / gene_product=unspecified product / transcript_product=unspecified product / location=Mono_scaffold00055:46243-47754(-) / protein_length=503 / sequence_SO=supercontig / SO=protein_coding / is_pseudo=false